MRKLCIVLLTAMASAVIAQQTQGPVEITADPTHHQVLENLFVRVFAVDVAPKASTLTHRHGHDYLSVAIGESQVTNNRPNQPPAETKFSDGEVRFSQAGLVHSVTNNGEGHFRNVTIELLQPTTNPHACKEACNIEVPCESADKASCVSVNKLWLADQWSVTLITLPPGATYPQHTHLANFLVVPLTDSTVKMQNQNSPESEVAMKTGQPTWNNPVVHTVRNAGTTTAKSIVVEFRGRPAGEGSESMGPNDGNKKPDAHHDHEHNPK